MKNKNKPQSAGILESKSDPLTEVLSRQMALRANFRLAAEKNEIEYSEWIKRFAKRIGRSPNTVYMWITSGFDGKGGARPIPSHHFRKLVEVGLIDPMLTHWRGAPATAKRR